MKVSKQSKVMLLAAGLALLAPSAMIAQRTQSPEQAAMRAKAEHMNAEFRAVETDRVSAENALVAKWESALDPNQYDLRQELAPFLSRVPEWQLYGASKANDFATMLNVLKGRASAGAVINGDSADVLGDTNDSLVYTPIAPCRVLDTRGAGARTGVIPANGTRTFDLTSDAFFDGQGVAGPCAGLPSFSHLGWAVNITVTGNSGNGWLTVWPFGGTEPTASQLNYAAGIWSVANGINVTGCYGCGDDITIRAAVASTHVIIDVVGFYQQAVGTAAAVSIFAGTGTSVPAGGRQYVNGGVCPAATRLVSGEVSHGGQDVAIGDFENVGGNSWRAWTINNDGVARTVTVWARCLDAPIEQ